MIMDEIKKATRNNSIEDISESKEDLDEVDSADVTISDKIDESIKDLSLDNKDDEYKGISFNYETVDDDKNISDSPTNTVDSGNSGNSDNAIDSDNTVYPINSNSSEVYPGDPDESQIEKATQNIVLNDITEPVVEEKYDNTDIVSPPNSPKKNPQHKKLNQN